MKKFAGLILGFLTLVFFTSIFSASASAVELQTGSIIVCKIITDQNNNVVTGSERSGATFTISGFTPTPNTSEGPATGVLPTTTFTTPLTYNADVLTDIQGDDAQCFTYNNLALGSYYWTAESIPAEGWDTPIYSDQFTKQATNITNLYSYDNNLFDGDQSNDGSRNFNADGHIILDSNRPTRTLIIANHYKAETPTPTITQTPNNTTSTSSNTPQCSDRNTTGTPTNIVITRSNDKAKISFQITDGDAADIFYKYSSAADWQYSVTGLKPDTNKFISTEISGLNPGLNYIFGARQRFGCGGGEITSISGSESTGQVLGASTMAGTGTFEQNLMNSFAVFGMLLLAAGYKSYAKEKKAI